MDDVARGDRLLPVRTGDHQPAVAVDGDRRARQFAARRAAPRAPRGRVWRSPPRTSAAAGRLPGRRPPRARRRTSRPASAARPAAAGRGRCRAHRRARARWRWGRAVRRRAATRSAPRPTTTASVRRPLGEDAARLALLAAVHGDQQVVGPLEGGVHAGGPGQRGRGGDAGEQRQPAPAVHRHRPVDARRRRPVGAARRRRGRSAAGRSSAGPADRAPAVCSSATSTAPSAAPLRGARGQVAVGGAGGAPPRRARSTPPSGVTTALRSATALSGGRSRSDQRLAGVMTASPRRCPAGAARPTVRRIRPAAGPTRGCQVWPTPQCLYPQRGDYATEQALLASHYHHRTTRPEQESRLHGRAGSTTSIRPRGSSPTCAAVSSRRRTRVPAARGGEAARQGQTDRPGADRTAAGRGLVHRARRAGPAPLAPTSAWRPTAPTATASSPATARSTAARSRSSPRTSRSSAARWARSTARRSSRSWTSR